MLEKTATRFNRAVYWFLPIAAGLAVPYWLVKVEDSVGLSTYLKWALVLGVISITAGTLSIMVASSAKLKAEFQRRQMSIWAFILGPLGAVQLSSGFILLFLAIDRPILMKLAICCAIISGLLSTIIRLFRGLEKHSN